MSTLTNSYEWIKTLPTSLLQLDNVPLVGYPPPFPWDKLTEQLNSLFETADLAIGHECAKWREKDLLDGLGDPMMPLNFAISGMEGNLTWVMASSDIALLMRLLLAKGSESCEVIDQDFQKGFYDFLAVSVVNTIGKLDFDKTLTPHLKESKDLPNAPSLCMDISISLMGKFITGRLVISPEFLQSWKERYSSRKLEIPSPLQEKIQLIIHLEAGQTSLKPSEWSKVVPGDFLVLDTCSLEPETNKGRIVLTIHGIPFYRGKIKDGNIKILEFPLLHEADTNMSNNSHNEEEEEEVEEESSLGDYDNSIEEEHETEEHETEEEHETDEHEVEEEALEFNEENEEELSELEKEEEPKEAKAQAEKTVKAETAPKMGIVTPTEIPLSIIVEVGRLQMSVKQITELQPGNVLELNIHPENGVDLVINGRRIAKGELLRLGETLGVRILDIG